MNGNSVLPRMLRQRIKESGSVEFLVTGWSMMPAILPYSRLRVVATQVRDLKPGDVVCYEIRDKIHCHRVIANIHEWLFTVGDSAPLARPEIVRKSALFGRVETVETGRFRLTGPWLDMAARVSPVFGPFLRRTMEKIWGIPGAVGLVKKISAQVLGLPVE